MPLWNRPVLRWTFWFLLVVSALCLRLPGLGKSIWLDEAFTLQEVYAADFFQAARASDHPFLYSFLLREWALFGQGEAFLRLPSVLFGVITIVVLVRVVSSLNRQAAVLVGLMTALSPTLLRLSQEIRDYSLLLLFTALSFYFANKLLQKVEPKSLIGFAFSLSGAVLSHLVGVFLIPALAGYLACQISRFKWRDIIRILLSLMVPAITFTVYYLLVLSPQVRGRTGVQWGESTASIELLVFSFLYVIGFFSWLNPLPVLFPAVGIIPMNPVSIVLLFFLLILITAILLGSWKKSWPYLLSAALYWGGMYVYSLLFIVVINERTVVPGLIPLVCFVAIQVTGSKNYVIRYLTYSVIGVLCLSAGLNWLTFNAWVPQENWRDLGESLAKSYQPGDQVVIFPGYASAAVSYYTPQIAASDFVLVPIDGRQPASPAELLHLFRNSGSVFLVYRADARSIAEAQTLPALQAALRRQFGHERALYWDRLVLFQYLP
jgi:hypothetical protein